VVALLRVALPGRVRGLGRRPLHSRRHTYSYGHCLGACDDLHDSQTCDIDGCDIDDRDIDGCDIDGAGGDTTAGNDRTGEHGS
jgi:hypothetical protein